ncbi:CRISPR-associated endonuclease Cas2 [Oenococcus sicerae]|uniref:CRISPR-associated endoribonuclease Cas2 n=1 Tax=Oenococcus sicerae TaxID=2203724 RepID=A0AAJ1R9Y2_9LACO|nr:CRISPR-associated endonuclease Cas2 [Oenococcus sicerae]MDN6899930.1 CRISPR-associated endonuclease Cas2 [Oenococcus sicerae]QAS69080.1 CRISPR-associated endonuclease Cas2 [Oenococcus sicerae]
MRYRVVRLMLFFDLPTLTSNDRRNYRQFRKELIKEGFLMIQESVYVRIVTNKLTAEFMEKRLSSIAPEEGIIQTLIVTEKQYASMKFLAGEQIDDVRNSDDKVVVI